MKEKMHLNTSVLENTQKRIFKWVSRLRELNPQERGTLTPLLVGANLVMRVPSLHLIYFAANK
jgi:hypothetical protein